MTWWSLNTCVPDATNSYSTCNRASHPSRGNLINKSINSMKLMIGSTSQFPTSTSSPIIDDKGVRNNCYRLTICLIKPTHLICLIQLKHHHNTKCTFILRHHIKVHLPSSSPLLICTQQPHIIHVRPIWYNFNRISYMGLKSHLYVIRSDIHTL